MKIKSALSLLAAASLALSSAAFAAGAKTYEVTGPVLEVTDSMIVMRKGREKGALGNQSRRQHQSHGRRQSWRESSCHLHDVRDGSGSESRQGR